MADLASLQATVYGRVQGVCFRAFVAGWAAELGLAGKPAPDAFLEASRRPDVDPARAVVVEDAISGVRAGRTGGFGLVIGVGEEERAQSLLDNGADIVVADLAALVVEDLPT